MSTEQKKMTGQQREILDYTFSRLSDDYVPSEHLRDLQIIADRLIIEYAHQWIPELGED